MPKTKAPAAESFYHHLDRLPEKEGAFELLRTSFRAIASFYGFEKMSYSGLDDAKAYQAVAKAGLMGERQPIILKSGIGGDVMMRASSALSALRAYKTHKMNNFPQPVKVYSEQGVIFVSNREDQPIQRRDEACLVMVGEEGPIAEAQIVQVMWKSLIEMGVPAERLNLVVNAIGCSQCFGHFRTSLTSHLRNKIAGLCKNCKRSFKSSPTRILVCEEEKCSIATSHAPQVLDNLCEACKKHLRGFIEFLDEMAIPYHIDTRRFRTGFWADTILFEFVVAPRPHAAIPAEAPLDAIVPAEGIVAEVITASVEAPVIIEEVAVSTVPAPTTSKRGTVLAEGGRLRRAAELMGAKGLEAVAGTILLDTVEQMVFPPRTLEVKPDVYLAQLGEVARRRSLRVLEMLRVSGITVKESLGRDAIKSQLTLAQKVGAPIALILGQKEVIDHTIIVRETESSIQETVPQEKMIDFLKRRLGKS